MNKEIKRGVVLVDTRTATPIGMMEDEEFKREFGDGSGAEVVNHVLKL